jgi:hypothetical protein
MTRTTPRKLRRSGKTSIALVTAVAALAGGAQALAPTPASAYNDGAGCTTDKWGFIVCEAPQTGSDTGGNENSDGYKTSDPRPEPASPSPFDPTPSSNKPTRPASRDDDNWPYRKPGETDDQLNARWHRESCRWTRKVYLRVKREGIDWGSRQWDLFQTTDDVLDRLADNYINGRCLKAVGPLRDDPRITS